MKKIFKYINKKGRQFVLSVPVRWKIIGIGILPVIILGVSLNYWIITGLSNWLSYILTGDRVAAAMSAGSRSVLFVTVIGAILSILLLAVLVEILTSPIHSLKKIAEEVANGKLDSRAEIWAQDEIGALAGSVNQMIDNLVEQQQNLSLTNRQLTAINRISTTAEGENEIHDVLYITLGSLLDLLNLEFAWVYLLDPEVNKIHLASWKNVPSQVENFLKSISPEGQCFSQLQLTTQSLTTEIITGACKQLLAAGYEGDRAKHITIPIIARDMQFGVINLHYPFSGEPDEETLELLEAIRVKISEVVANAWLQFKLREKELARQILLESLVTAQEDERSHLARELHDQAGQSLTNLLIRLKSLEDGSKDSEQKEKLSDMQKAVAETIDQIRDLSYSLRPPALEEFGLAAAINSLVDDLSPQLGYQIQFKNRIDGKLPKNIETVLYRIVQEGLTNVTRHAKASKVVIELEPQENLIFLKIQDDGKGFNPSDLEISKDRRHLGLISMNERAELIGGKLEMYSQVGKGTTIKVKVPYYDWEMLNV